ncbi:DUF1702 family protein [Streptosporangium amethystogenes]|uniref:DUF1702 family protein n=1 Tax=Streptosporangium amethystogenes TaxID=2002 RepID=UPI00378B559F
MSNAEGTRTVAQSDDTETAGAEAVPEGTPDPAPPRRPEPTGSAGPPDPAGHPGPQESSAPSPRPDFSEPGSPEPGLSEPGASAQGTSAPGTSAPLRPNGVARLLWQNPARVGFGVRRFRLGPARERLEGAERSFTAGFNAVVAGEAERIDDLREDLRGFGYEGAGMACATLDVLTLTGGRRLRELLSGPGMRYPHLIHMGTGRAYARMRLRPMWGVRSVHPLLRWLAHDGFGFHQGFFSADRTVGRQRTAGLMDRTRRAIFDQGLGRMLWFHECAGAGDVVLRIAEFPAGRRADLWSGVGLAAAYTGGASAADLGRLASAAAEDGFRAHLAQGCAFACASRLISAVVPEHTVAAAPVLCGAEADEAAAWTDTALVALGHNAHSGDHYQAWRAGIRKAWARRDRDS